MRRTLETAYHTFKNHKNFNQMEIILNPLLREKITISGDIPLRNKEFLKQLKDIYQPLFG